MVSRVVVVDTDLGFKKIVSEMKALSKAEVTAGVQSGSKTSSVSNRGRRSKANVNIAQYASENEFGVPSKNIPERSFIRAGFDENLNILEPFISKRYGLIIDGKMTIDQGLGQIGLALQDMIKRKILQIQIPPNSKKTIALKKSSKPLIDFGFMLKSIRYVVKK